MELNTDFLTDEERRLTSEFFDKGYVIRDAEDRAGLDRIQTLVAGIAADHLGVNAPSDPGVFLNEIHTRVTGQTLNDLRLTVFNRMNQQEGFRRDYFSQARTVLGMLVGNEIAMQRRVNLSIQMPDDDSSILPVHADVLSGDSPYEVVQWTPMVDCYGTKAMYILPPKRNQEVQDSLKNYPDADALMEDIRDDLVWIEIAYGQVMVFNQNLLHGNVVNAEPETRWSMNCRYKGVFTPYADKRLGEFFEPITLRPASAIGIAYQLPGGFRDA